MPTHLSRLIQPSFFCLCSGCCLRIVSLQDGSFPSSLVQAASAGRNQSIYHHLKRGTMPILRVAEEVLTSLWTTAHPPLKFGLVCWVLPARWWSSTSTSTSSSQFVDHCSPTVEVLAPLLITAHQMLKFQLVCWLLLTNYWSSSKLVILC